MNPRLSTSIPARMAHLPKDHRGYPIPHIVMIDKDGKPHFTINDHMKVNKAGLEKRCGICGGNLYPKRMWMLGGPLSAFHPHGAYFDGPLHQDCAQYALRVCPYLALPNYSRRIDGAGFDGPANGVSVLVDPTMIPERPALYVLAATDDVAIAYRGDMLYFHPRRPWKAIEYWRDGVQLNPIEGAVMSQKVLDVK